MNILIHIGGVYHAIRDHSVPEKEIRWSNRLYKHNERKKEAYKSNPDINVVRGSDNYHLVLPKQTYLREDCVSRMQNPQATVMVETLITASAKFMNALPLSEQREFFSRALGFVESKVGKENIISAVMHMDEHTPHMHLPG